MDNKSDLGIVLVLIVAALLFTFCGFISGHARGVEVTRQEAVDNHAASWECDQKDGTRHIKWHACPKHKVIGD